MATFDLESEEQITSAFLQAVKSYAPPAGLQAALRERLSAKIQDLISASDSSPAGARSAEPQVANSATWPREWTAQRTTRYAAGLALVASLLVVLAIWGRHGDLGASVAFADVQEAARHIETATVVVDCLKTPWMNYRVLYRSDCDVVRTEWPNGMVCLRNTKQSRRLVLNPKRKTARTEDALRGVDPMHIPREFATPREFLDTLANIEQTAVTPLGEREFDGRKLVGFALPRDKFAQNTHMLCHVWADPQTRLPVRYEFLPEDPGNFAATFLHYTMTFTFNRPLDASLFRLLPPEGYTLLHEGLDVPYLDQLPLPPRDEKLASPVIAPGVGIGPAKFGMSVEQVIEVLGQPDNASDHREPTPEEQRQLDEAYQKASKEANEKGLRGSEKGHFVNEATSSLSITQRAPNGTGLDYLSRGFGLVVLKDQGLVRIFCYGENAGMRPFTGKTSKGIGMGATVQQIEKAYGSPSHKSEQLVDGLPDILLVYQSLRMVFQVRDGRLWHISLEKP